MRVVRFLGVFLLASYITLHLIAPTDWSELFVYNIISIAAIVAIAFAPHISDKIAKPSFGLAVAFWALGSAVASSAIFFSLSTVSNTISNVLYLLFYPFAIIGLPRLLGLQIGPAGALVPQLLTPMSLYSLPLVLEIIPLA